MIDPEVIERLRRASSSSGGKRGSTGGLFQQKRDSISTLTDPLVVAHLNRLNRAAMDEARAGVVGDGGGNRRPEESTARGRLGMKIAVYNRGKHQGAFTVTQTEGMDFEGALRFYYEDGSKMAAKAVWLTNQTTVDEILPSIREKFNITDNGRWRTAVYHIQNHDEILLAGEERPLDIAINSKRSVRFVLKMEPRVSDTPPASQLVPPASNDKDTHRKSLSQFFGVESCDLAVPYYAAPVAASPVSKSKHGSPTKVNKKQNSVSLSSNGRTNSGHLSSKPSDSAGTDGNDSMPGLLLKTQTPKFIRKLQSGEGPLRSFTKKDKGSNGKISSKALDPRKRSRAKSLSIIFDRSFAHSKKEEALKHLKELSSEDSAPGLLKIFGNQICPNATYKSVLASGQSSAVALVKVVLERYSLPVDSFGEYVLCDVIGNYKANPEKASRILGLSDDFEEKQEWMTECMRVMGDDERPLAVKSFWKPEEGFARRFEIRRRSDIAAADADTITHDINLNAKRLQLPKAHRASSNTSLTCLQEDGDKIVEESSPSSEGEIIHKEPQRTLSQGQTEQEEMERSDDEPLPMHNLLPPRDCPYLLTLRGDNPETDQILYILDDPVCLIGHSRGTDKKAGIKLESMDVNGEHCRILKRNRSGSTDSIEGNECNIDSCDMFAEPVRESKVLLNGAAISQRAKLNPGDLIGLGDRYLFLLKVPLIQPISESSLMGLLSSFCQSESSSHPRDIPSRENISRAQYASPHIAAKAQEYSADNQRLKISYPMTNEDKVLRGIASLLHAPLEVDAGDEFTLSLSYMMCMCVEHSAYNFDQEKTKRLMLKVATLIQTLAWDKTEKTARKQQEKSSDVQSALGALFPDLRVIVCLLTNALEILNFLQASMGDYIAISQGEEGVKEGGKEGEEVAGGSGIEDEALVELEEVVIYTFQQMVYYLTKTLYIAIPNFLDTNPFSDNNDDDDDIRTKGMDNVLFVFQMTFDLMRDLDVHPEITSQLFAYLLFFTNASLFNMLVERGSNGKFYKWSKGVQIRGNLDALEVWIQAHDLQNQAKFLTRVSTAIDLLATPKVQLMQADWCSLQHDFPGLNATQLHHILGQYQLGANQTRPTGWLPPAEEMKSATDTANILELFDNHPALVLPSSDFKMDLRQPISNEHFTKQLHELKRCLPYITFSIGKPDDQSLTTRAPVETPVTEKAPSSPGKVEPVPPPRSKSYRYPQSDQDADATNIEMLKHPLEATQAVANTVKVPPIEVNFRSAEEKMSPQVFLNKPLFANKTNEVESDVNIDNESIKMSPEISNIDTDTENSDSVTNIPTTTTAPSEIATEPLGNPKSEPNCVRQDVGVANKENERRGRTGDCHDDGGQVSQNRQQARAANAARDEFEEPRKPCTTLLSSSTSSSCSSSASLVITVETEETTQPVRRKKDSVDDIFVVDLEKGEEGVGLGLIDGIHTPLRSQGIYVCKLAPGGSAMQDGRLVIGDRILAVNGTSLVGADYNSAMHLIRTSGKKLRFLVAKSEPSVALKITASTC